MKPEEALNIIEKATGELSANRQTHVVIQQAIQILRKAIAEPTEPIDKDKSLA